MKLVVLFCVAVLYLTQAQATPDDFSSFTAQYKKVYHSNEERERRERIFNANMKQIQNHNSQPGVTWLMAMNEFGDISSEEFKDIYLSGYKRLPGSGPSLDAEKESNSALPESIDWRDMGVVSEVKNQGSCGSCWAFATAEQIESYAAINNISVPELSTQEITTCTPNPLHCGGKGGCKGSIPQLAYSYIQLFGLTTEDEYPYWSGITGMTGSCKYDLENRTPVVGISGYNTIPSNNLEATLEHVGSVGPLAVAADAGAWQFYGSGVFNGCSYQNNIGLNHAVQLVGYGSDASNGDYWIVRNSWGKNWGEHGYIRLQRESEQTCGVNSTPMDGTACEDGPGSDVQEVCGMCGILFDSSYPLGTYEFHL